MMRIKSKLWLPFLFSTAPCISSFTVLDSKNKQCHVRETSFCYSVSKNQTTDSSPPAFSKPGTESSSTPHTSALLRISYDGSRFTGWSSANSGSNSTNQKLPLPSKRRRRRGVMGDIPEQQGFVRPVEGILRQSLAKIFGNVDPKRIVLEGCSRTDRGVHAQGMIAQVYCLQEEVLEVLEESKVGEDANEALYCSIPGKRKPHPISSTDSSYFEPMPMGGNLSRLVFALNRMRPPDVQVTGIAPTPSIILDKKDDDSLPFHPSLSCLCKTYEYRISVGAMHDPTTKKFIWHTKYDKLNIDKMEEACQILRGTQDFSAFQGAPRGPDDKRRRLIQSSTPRGATCTLSNVAILGEKPPIGGDHYFRGLVPPIQNYKIVITGDRFLYKMVRFLVGAIVAVGTGKLEPEDVGRALDSGHWNVSAGETIRRKQFECAPAHGLMLMDVDYGDDITLDWQPLRY